jgi:flagellar biogenesis protein FliO
MLGLLDSASAVARAPLQTAAPTSYGEMMVLSLAMVAAVCAIGFAVTRAFGGRWRGPGRGGGLLEVIARQPLEPRRSLFVVRVAGRTLLLGTSELGVAMLTELDGLPEAPRAAPPTFAALVREARARWVGRRDGDSEVRGPDGAAAREPRQSDVARGAGTVPGPADVNAPPSRSAIATAPTVPIAPMSAAAPRPSSSPAPSISSAPDTVERE